MKNFALLFLVVSTCCFADQFYSQSGFNQAIGNRILLVDNFASGGVDIPGVSVSSDVVFNGFHPGAGNGHFVPGKYVDATDHYTVTTWAFTTPVYAFGGDWNMSMSLGGVNAGLTVAAFGRAIGNPEIYQMPDAVVPPFSSYPNPPFWPASGFSGFWGFVSNTPIYSVSIVFGDEGPPGGSAYSQPYEFTNMQITEDAPAAVPEPASIVLFVLGAGMLVMLTRWRAAARV